MKTLLTTLVLTTAMAGAVNAEAQERGKYSYKNDSYTQGYKDDYRGKRGGKRYKDNDRYYDDQRFSKRGDRHFNGRNIRLDLPVHFRGDGRLSLKRLARQYHGINLNNYRLKRVVLNSHGRRDGAARLRVGQRVSDLVYLGNGRSVIHAPNVRGSGRWVLKLDDARVSNVRLVLEPRKRHYVHNGYKRDRFAKRAWKGPYADLRW